MTSDVARGGEAVPPNAWHTIPPVCIAYIPAGQRVPRDLRGCIIRHHKPGVVA